MCSFGNLKREKTLKDRMANLSEKSSLAEFASVLSEYEKKAKNK